MTQDAAHADDADPLRAGGRALQGAARFPAPAARPLRVAVLHNTKDQAPRTGDMPADALAELDSPRTVNDFVAAIRGLGHTVWAVEGGPLLAQHLAEQPADFCFNTCEGYRGDSREAQVPAILEMLGMPYSASRVLALAVTLDKAMTKRVLAYYGLPTPRFQEFSRPDQPLDPALAARLQKGGGLFVKPNREGTGMGIYGDAVARTPAALRERVDYLLQTYRQTVLVEEYIEGRDITCGLVGNFSPDGGAEGFHVLPISEVDYTVYPPGTEPFYSYNLKVHLADHYRCLCPAPLGDALTAEVRRLTLETFRACGCQDVARVDFRLDAHNNNQPMILEINALPGMAYNSDLTLCAEAYGWSHYDLIQAVFNTAAARCGFVEASYAPPAPVNGQKALAV